MTRRTAALVLGVMAAAPGCGGVEHATDADIHQLFEVVRVDTLRPSPYDPVGHVTDALIWNDHLAIVDGLVNKVKVFGPDGSLERAVGRPGDGPGEFRYALSAAALPDGRLAVAELEGKISVFSPDGEFERAWNAPMHMVGSVEATSDGRILLLAMLRPRDLERPHDMGRLGALVYSSQGVLLDSLTIPEDSLAGVELSFAGPRTDFANGTLYFAHQSRNRVTRLAIDSGETVSDWADTRYVRPDFSLVERVRGITPEVNEWFNNEAQWLTQVTAVDDEHYVVTFMLPKRKKSESPHRVVLMSAVRGEVAQVDTTEFPLFHLGAGRLITLRHLEDDTVEAIEYRLRPTTALRRGPGREDNREERDSKR